MAGFHTKTFSVYDDYTTPKSAWEAVVKYIPKDKIIWEAFYCDGKSGKYLKELGYNTIHAKIDFFVSNWGDIIVSNPPFSLTKEVLARLQSLGKPFMLILPSSKINTQYVRNIFKDDKDPLQIIIPRKRIQFVKMKDGKPEEGKNACNFDCFYYCWKMDLPRDIVWLN
jgi:hypothetical protein